MSLARGKRLLLIGLAALLCATVSATPAPSPASAPAVLSSADKHNIDTIRALLEQPEEGIDLARAKLTIDKMIDPHTDIDGTIAKIDAMAEQVKGMLPPHASTWDMMLTMRRYLYQPGPWNDNQPWHYNFDQPLGNYLPDKLVANYLTTKKGQCISMPLLYLFIAQRVGMNVAYALAPNHSLVKIKIESGAWENIEATSGGIPSRLEFYQQHFPMSKASLDSGAYMRPLSKRESIAEMTEVLAQHYSELKKYEQVLAISELALKYAPNNIGARLFQINAYHAIIRRDFMGKYKFPEDIPGDQHPRFGELTDRAAFAERQVFALGFVMPTSAAKSKYLEVVHEANAQSKRNN
jgi:regulator of sirC expression with transglutaminase-like and TPR domain